MYEIAIQKVTVKNFEEKDIEFSKERFCQKLPSNDKTFKSVAE